MRTRKRAFRSNPRAMGVSFQRPISNIEVSYFIDFLGKQSDNSVDLILTDPLYVIAEETNFAQAKEDIQGFSVPMDFGDWDRQEILLDTFFQEAYRILRRGGTIIVFYDVWRVTPLSLAMDEAGFSMLRQIFWEKTNPVPLNGRSTYLCNSREIAITGVKGSGPTFHSKNDRGVYNYPIPHQKEGRTHPSQKPIQLFIELIQKHSKPNEWVLDPFLGSGTTAVASHLLGRHFKGCDAEASYVKGAQERVKAIPNST
ncbi:MAG: site-specific DNA-methyltransferase [Cytophagales bacterium]|nr:site-specific DNA-methyltransferase [Cytophagales bacterium]